MRIRNFQSDTSSKRFASRLNKVFLSQSESQYNNKKSDDVVHELSSKLYKSLKESPKSIYTSIEKFDPIATTNTLIDKWNNCCTVSNLKSIVPLLVGIMIMLPIIFLLAYVTSSSSSASLSLNTMKKDSDIESSKKQLYLLEIDEIVDRLIEIRKTGKMMEFEDTLSLVIPKYCLNHIKTPLDVKAEESFHLNAASMIKFIANGVCTVHD